MGWWACSREQGLGRLDAVDGPDWATAVTRDGSMQRAAGEAGELRVGGAKKMEDEDHGYNR